MYSNTIGSYLLLMETFLTVEIVSIPFKIQFDADLDPKKIESDFNFASPGRTANAELRARTNIKKPEDYSFKLHLGADKREFEVIDTKLFTDFWQIMCLKFVDRVRCVPWYPENLKNVSWHYNCKSII